MAKAIIGEDALEALLGMIEQAARAGERCPTNAAICERFGLSSASSVTGMVRTLERRGLIRVVRGFATRVVTILATGAVTAGSASGRHVPRGQGTGYRERAKRPKARAMAMPAPIARPVPAPLVGTWVPAARDQGGGCRFIDGDPGRAGWTWCGAPRIEGGAWCACHHDRVYVRRPVIDGAKAKRKGKGR